jgi:hypothetical protein
MKRAALGLRMHSGWGVLVAVAGNATSVDLMDRRRIVITDPKVPGANQPYHHAASLGLEESERYLANCAAIAERLATASVGDLVRELGLRQHQVVGSAVLLASGRPLPSLANILASHALIHTADGEFFRRAVRQACEGLRIPVTAMKERELHERAQTAFGNHATRVERRIARLGSTVGPPWTKDHKTAALAAAMVLAGARPRLLPDLPPGISQKREAGKAV